MERSLFLPRSIFGLGVGIFACALIMLMADQRRMGLILLGTGASQMFVGRLLQRWMSLPRRAPSASEIKLRNRVVGALPTAFGASLGCLVVGGIVLLGLSIVGWLIGGALGAWR
jgi:hypothetical protein